ncbi:hypothetical protein LNO75_00980 [Mycoplasma sp. T363T]|uniref:hypothetical protein n=1 Tax=Mycoplasma bradburyae TaxID=2963128 RepID=UPI00233F8EBE|nr:hypothetical protein [Mycoplasma bradburyae]MDC4163151.1 hypothetical protein [Mycoplasma bradburyae]
MKRKNILKFISLLGVGSFVVLAAASCKQPVAEKPTKPTEPKNPNNGGGTTTTNPPSTGGSNNQGNSGNSGTNTANPPAGNGSNNTSNTTGNNGSSGSASGTMVTTPNPEEEKMKLKSFLSTIKEENFDVLRNNDKANRSNVNLDELKKEDLKLQDVVKEKNPVKSGWTLDVELVSNSKNKNVGSIDINIKYTKDDNSMSTDPVKLTLIGFKSLKTDLSSILFKTQSVGVSLENANTKENKTVLDLGSVGFSTLVDLNTKSMASSSISSSESTSGNGMETKSVSLSLRDDSQTKPVGDATGHTDTQIAPAMMGNKFSAVLAGWINSGSNSNIKTELQKLETAYTGFKVADLYIDGAAKLNSLYKKSAEDWQGSYYLTSKDDSSKLTLKVKTLNNWSLEIPSIVVQDLLPDSVKVFVSKIDVPNVSVDINNESNLDAYKTKVTTEGQNTKFALNGNVLTVQPDKLRNNQDRKPLLLNPIKVPFVGSGKTQKILFKAKYIFDGTGIFNGDVFGTRLKFRKAFKWDDSYDKQALNSTNILSSIWYGTNYIPGSNEKNPSIPRDTIDNDFNYYSNGNQFFLKGNGNDEGFNNTIYGTINNPNGLGVDQLIENNNDSSGMHQTDKTTKINDDKATNFLIFPRITYKKSNDTYGYLWTNDLTILYFEAPENTARM